MTNNRRYNFSDWPNPDIPMVSAGVYAIWNDDVLIYCGMSGRELDKAIAQGKRKYGLVNRLNSHASGRLSGDQFCVYVANRIVIPQLSMADLPRFETGELKLDGLTKEYIHNHLSYEYIVVADSREAFSLEDQARRGEVFGSKPFLNPISN